MPSDFEKLTTEELRRIIIIEGVDGAGKTTQVAKLAAFMTAQGLDVITPREPGGTEIGESIREILLHDKSPRSPRSALDLFNIGRRELARQVIIPALKQGKWVVQDRREDSSLAYQGFGQGLNKSLVRSRCREALGTTANPGRRIIIDIPLDVSLQRAEVKGGDNFERIGSEFRNRVLTGYRWIIVNNPDVLTIDGTQSPEQVHHEIISKALG